MKNFIQSGTVVPLVAPADVSSGDGVLVGSLFGIAATDATAGASVACKLECVFELPKAAEDVSQGADLFWDDAAKNLTTTASGNTLVAKAITAAGTGVPTVRARLNG